MASLIQSFLESAYKKSLFVSYGIIKKRRKTPIFLKNTCTSPKLSSSSIFNDELVPQRSAQTKKSNKLLVY